MATDALRKYKSFVNTVFYDHLLKWRPKLYPLIYFCIYYKIEFTTEAG